MFFEDTACSWSCEATFRRGISGSGALSPSIEAVESEVPLFVLALLEEVEADSAASAELLNRAIVKGGDGSSDGTGGLGTEAEGAVARS